MLTLGCPSLAKRFRDIGVDCVLVDRQPLQYVDSQVELDIQVDPPIVSGFRTAIVDPPWYPEYVPRWIAWAAGCVGEGGVIYALIWPSDTRPTGEIEYLTVRKWIQTWATMTELDYHPAYDLPFFEIASHQASKDGNLAKSPRLGRLIRIDVQKIPHLPKIAPGREIWTRFVFNDYQLAVRTDIETSTSPFIDQLPNAVGWIWPYVSRRAPKRSKINIWSSRNEVALATGINAIIFALRNVSLTQSVSDFESVLSPFPSLIDWKIPRPPYWRTSEWLHHQ